MGVEPDRYSCQKFHMGQGRWFSSHEHYLPEDSTHIRQLTCNSSSGGHSTLVQPRQASVNMWCTLTQHVFKFLVACEVPHKTLQAWRRVLVLALGRRGITQLRSQRPTWAASGAPLTKYLFLAATQYLTNQLKGQKVCFGLWVKGVLPS